MITSSLVMPAIAITTVCTVIFIGLGFLPRPSRATVIWSIAFAIPMVATYLWLTHDLLAYQWLRELGSALALTPIALLWSGVRAYRRKPHTYVWVACTFIVIGSLLMLAANAIGMRGVGFRVVFCAAAVFAAILVWELAQLGPRLRDEALPLMGVCGLFVIVALVYIASGILVATGALGVDSSTVFIRTLSFIGIVVFSVCTLVTTLLLTLKAEETAASPTNAFEGFARRRLARAQASQEQWWSLLDVRLDDPDEIRTASSTAAFNDVACQFADHIDSVFPADADIDRVTETRFMILVPRSQGGVRELLTDLLERVSATKTAGFPLRVSASIGWVPVSAIGYDFDVLTALADAAAQAAQTAGGDRWERIHGTA